MKKAVTSGFKVRYLYRRSDTFVYRRPIPPRFQILADNRTEFKESLHTNDQHIAMVKYGDIKSKYDAIFDQFKRGIPLSRPEPLPVAEYRKITKRLGFEYRSADELIRNDNADEMRLRVGQAFQNGETNETIVRALFGKADNSVTLNEVFDFYFEHKRDTYLRLNKREISKKISPIKLAINRFTDFAGKDFNILSLTKTKAMGFRSYLIDLIEAKKINQDTANKQITHIRKILSTYLDGNDIQKSNPFAGIHFDASKASRPAFSIQYLNEVWFKGDPFASLNPEAKNILFAMIDTGCGPKEICGLNRDEIHLTGPIPFISILPNQHRQLKTDHRSRVIPLVGKSLAAFEAFPEGFPRYRRVGGADSVSALIVKYLTQQNLRETNEHTSYSLRHTFKDRLRIHKVPTELQNYLMGHVNPGIGSHYGEGYTLQMKFDYLKIIETDWSI